MDVNERIKFLIESEYKGNKTAFARAVNVSPTVVENIVGSRKGKPSYDVFDKICAYANISAEWLLTGSGEMFKRVRQLDDRLEEYVSCQSNKTSVKMIDNQNIPLYDITAAAGIVQIIQGRHSHIAKESISIPHAPRCDGALFVRGDSMYPILKSGDILLYSEIHDFNMYVVWGEMYIVAFGHEGDDPIIAVKYVKKSDNPESIVLASQNQHHADKEIPISLIRAVARVNAFIRFQTL